MKPYFIFIAILASVRSWTNVNVRPKLGNALGSWTLLDTTNSHVKHKNGRLDVIPDVTEHNSCIVKFTIVQHVLFNSCISKYVEGVLVSDQLCWRNQSHSEIVLLGIGLKIDSFDFFTAKPIGSCRKIKYEFLNLNTLRVFYEKDVFVFTRTQNDVTAILVPLEMFLLMQVLSSVYSHWINNT
jgi:hypothetical protein